MTPLRQRFVDDLRLRNRSPKTIETYVRHVAQFAQHFGRSPEQLNVEHVRQYQLHLLHERKASWSGFNQAVSALRFLYGTTLGRPEYLERLPYGRRPRTLPLVLSQEEVLELLRCTRHAGCSWLARGETNRRRGRRPALSALRPRTAAASRRDAASHGGGVGRRHLRTALVRHVMNS